MAVESLSGPDQGSLEVFCRAFGNFFLSKPMILLEFWYAFCFQFYPRVRLLKDAALVDAEALPRLVSLLRTRDLAQNGRGLRGGRRGLPGGNKRAFRRAEVRQPWIKVGAELL